MPALLVLTWTFGMVASRSFETVLRIDSEFAVSFAGYFRAGLNSLLPFAALWVMTAAAAAAVVAGLGPLVRWRAANVWRRWSDWSSRLNPQSLAWATLLAGFVVSLALVWANRELFDALFALQQRPADAATQALSSSARQQHLAFSTLCAVLSCLLTLAALAWFPVLRQRSSQPAAIHRLGWAMLLLALIVMLAPTMPRRVLFEQFRVVEYDGEEGLMIGSAGDHLLLYSSARRTTVRVRRDAAGLRVTEMTRQVFED